MGAAIAGMRRYFESLRPADLSTINSVPDGLFLVRVDHMRCRRQAQKPFYQIRFSVFEPKQLAGCLMTGRLYCTPRAIWKFSWFLRDFGYDTELLVKNEVDERELSGLRGVVKIRHAIVHGLSVLNLDSFAPAARWQELSPPGDTWDRMLQQGIQLLERFCQDGRVQVRQPQRNLQVKLIRSLSSHNEFVAFVDAIGFLDDTHCVLEWKTTSSRYPEQPDGLLALDPQLVCYSWMTGITEVAQIVFVRKRLVEVQYLHTSITEEQRQEFGQLVSEAIERIERAQFLPHSGIRFPQNPCTSCPYIGLCLGKPEVVASALVRRAGAENLDWINELAS